MCSIFLSLLRNVLSADSMCEELPTASLLADEMT